MATQSFFGDMIIDTPEALANLIAFAEEEPHLKVDGKVKIRYDNEEEVMNRLMARYLEGHRGSLLSQFCCV